jgi:hypothetical protein
MLVSHVDARCPMTGRLRRYGFWCSVAALAMGPAAVNARAQEMAPKPVLQQFQKGVDRYLALRWKAVRELPPLPVGGQLRDVIPILEAQIRAVRRAHEDARQGELFTPQVSMLFRTTLADAVEEMGLTPEDLIAEMHFDVPSFLLPLRVNDRAPWLRAVPAPDCVLMALPALPYELQYRLVYGDLVLFDVDLGLVVDVLPNALVVDSAAAR